MPTEGPHAEVSDRDFGWGQMGDAVFFSAEKLVFQTSFFTFSLVNSLIFDADFGLGYAF